MKQITIQELFGCFKLNASQESLGYQWEVKINQKEVERFFEEIQFFSNLKPIKVYDLGTIKLYDFPNKEICDGEQRLTTIVIFVAVLLQKLRTISELYLSEIEVFEDLIKRNATYKFSTIKEDNQLFRDFVVDKIPIKKNTKISESGKRIINTFNYFNHKIKNKNETELSKLLNCLINAKCLLKIVKKYEFVYSNTSYNQLYNLLKEEDISKSLAYMIDYKEYENLKITPNKFSIEVSNKDITLVILIWVGFENEEYQNLKHKKNVHIVSFNEVVLEMFEFKKKPIKIIPILALTQMVIERSKTIEISDIKSLMNLKL